VTKLLLDTQVLLWAAGEPARLSEAARALLLDEANGLFFSSASLWEVVIKRGLGREDFRVDPVRLRRMLLMNGYEEVPITSDHALALDRLPPLHRDPFDRMLVAQARTEGMRLVTADERVARYGEAVHHV
jgi:PIN domain nuclease of toxin-antitoxin system